MARDKRLSTSDKTLKRVRNIPSGRRILTEVVIGLTILLLIGTVWAWWHFIYSNPQRVFTGMLENNLRTSSVTRLRVQQSGNQRLEQYVRLNTGADDIAQGRSTITQTGNVTAKVDTESIGTPTADYVRYTDIHTNQKDQNGKDLDFSKVLNIWGKSETSRDDTLGELYSESSLGVVPFGNLTAAQRAELMHIIKDRNVYKADFANVKRGNVNGRPQYAYTVEVDPEGYVTMLKKFGEFMGLTQTQSLDPAEYKGAQALQFRITIDVWSRHLSSLSYQTSSRQEAYGGYGIVSHVALPQDTIPVDELQDRVQSIQ